MRKVADHSEGSAVAKTTRVFWYAALLTVFFASSWQHLAAETTSQPLPAELNIQATIPRSGYGLDVGFGSVWMMSEGRLARINLVDNSVIDIDIPMEGGASLADIDKYRGIAVGEGAVWVPDMGSSTIYKIDPQSNTVVMKIPTDIFGSQGNIGVGEGAIWVVTFDNRDKTLTRYNAESGAVEAKIVLPRPGKGVLVEGGSIWVTAADQAELYRIDPKSNQLLSTIPINDRSHVLTASDGSVWIGYESDGVVQRVDGRTGQVIATIATGALDMESDGDITAGGGFVWFITRSSTIAQIEPKTNSLRGIFRAKSGSVIGRRIRYADGSLWVSGGSIFRIEGPK